MTHWTNFRIRILPAYLTGAMTLLFWSATPVWSQPQHVEEDTAQQEETSDTTTALVEEIEQNRNLIIQEGLSESSQLIAVEEDEESPTSAEPREDAVITPAPLEPDAREDAAPAAAHVAREFGKVVEASRRPLIFIEQKIPFFSKRNILFFGRLELDVARYNNGVLKEDGGVEVRRLRLGIAGQVRFLKGWNYKFELDLTDKESTLADAYFSYRTKRWGTFRIGNQRVAQTLSGQTSSVSIAFMERPLPVLTFTLQRRLAVGWDTHLHKVGANIALFYKDPNENIGATGYAARFYFNPVKFDADVLHLGASFMDLDLQQDGQFRARPESNNTNVRLVDTGVRPNVTSQEALGIELAGARGPLTVRSEYYSARWSRDIQEDTQFSGWYVEASWFLTGESSNYRNGKFIRPAVKGPRGAWEVATRVSSIDLNDRDVRGGKQTNFSVGVNWYSKTHWRVMGNLIKVKADGPQGKQEPWIIQLRGQYFF